MRGDAFAGDQAGVGQHEHAGTDRTVAARLRHRLPQPFENFGILHGVRTAAARHQKRVHRKRQIMHRASRLKCKTQSGLDRFRGRPDGEDLVELPLHQEVGEPEHLQRAGDIQRGNAGIDQHRDAPRRLADRRRISGLCFGLHNRYRVTIVLAQIRNRAFSHPSRTNSANASAIHARPTAASRRQHYPALAPRPIGKLLFLSGLCERKGPPCGHRFPQPARPRAPLVC